MYLVQVGLCLWLISQRCYAGLTKDIEQTKILDDGLELSNRELTQGERDFAMFPELSSKDSFPDHGDTERSKEESTDVSPASSAEGDVPTGSQARLSSAIDSDRSSEDGPISAISKGKQHAHSVPLYEQYISSYGGSARRDFQGQLSHYQGNPRFDPHATAMHPFPITNQYWALAPNDLPGPDVLIPAFSNAEVAAMHSPFGQAMAVMPSPLTPGLLSDHIQAPLPYYNTHLIHEGNPQEFVPSHISDPQSIRPPRDSNFFGSRKSSNRPPYKTRGQGLPRTALDATKSPEQQIIPEGSSEQKSEELNKASGSRKQVWKETDRTKLDQTKSPIPRPEPSKSSEEILSTVSSQSSKIDGSKSSVESIPTNPNDLESNPAPIERSKILDNSKGPSTSTPVETSRSLGQHVESVDKQVAEVKPTTSRLWADIVSEPEKEKKVAQSFPEKGKKIVSHRKGKPFEKQNVEVKNTVSPLGSGINSRLRSGSNTKTRASESGSLLDPIPAQQDSEWTEYRQKKGRKGRFLAQKPASRAGVHSEVDRPTPFDVPDGASISNEAGPRSHTQDTVVDLTESHSQEATESPSNNINTPYNANPEPNDESSGSGLGASKIKAIIADKIHKPPTKHKGKSRRPKTKAQIGKTEGEGKLDVPNSETTEPQITSLPESETELQQKMDTILSKVLQRDNKKDRTKIVFDTESYEKLLSLKSPSGNVWANYRARFQSEFGNSFETQRRWNAFAAQIDQHMATRSWNDLAYRTAEPVKKLALQLKIDEEWPTFDKIDMAYGQKTMEMLEELTPEHHYALSQLFGEKLLGVRLATVYVASRRSPKAKQFTQSQLVDFMKRGGTVPILYEVHDCLEMQSAEVNWSQMHPEDLRSRLDRLVKAMTGKISNGGQFFDLTKQSWTLTWTREYLSRLSETSTKNVAFLPRLKKFYEIVNDNLDSRDVASWRGVPISERADRPVWLQELLTPGQVLAGANFDLSVELIGMMINALKQNLNTISRQSSSGEKVILWPANAPTEVLFKAVPFVDFFEFCGFRLKLPLARKFRQQ
ncbi:Hypothetical protein MELLADRAFT_94815 [Melampsora larici-populina 98AG31]|uniref:Secreted protein n=1 Tax=Melampsora larici-populina (strain 98AG31 / pathotype 3-4-7) TaxID=747676 RepID=F4S812_MELLP|nr:Hypothetical protein MELLADRAFT_94815 [Melampsora larici-populina 98AG31]EGF99236.1 Hypothetical protein MELLADRAFT_94815 [Melampsora larici-populina 98AG31]